MLFTPFRCLSGLWCPGGGACGGCGVTGGCKGCEGVSDGVWLVLFGCTNHAQTVLVSPLCEQLSVLTAKCLLHGGPDLLKLNQSESLCASDVCLCWWF